MLDHDGREVVVLILPAVSLLRKAAVRSIELEDGRFECHFPVAEGEFVFDEVCEKSPDELPEIPRLGRDGNFLTEEVIEMSTGQEPGALSRIESSIIGIENHSKELHDRLVLVMGPSQRVEDTTNEPPVSGHSSFADRLSAIELNLAEILERLEV